MKFGGILLLLGMTVNISDQASSSAPSAGISLVHLIVFFITCNKFKGIALNFITWSTTVEKQAVS